MGDGRLQDGLQSGYTAVKCFVSFYVSQLFNVHGVKDVGQAEIHTTEPLVPEPSASKFELAIDKLKSHKSPGIDQIPAELIKAWGRTICLEIHKPITSILKKEQLPEE